MKDTGSKIDKRIDAPVYSSLMKAAAQGDEETIIYLLEIASNKNKKSTSLPITTTGVGAAADEEYEMEEEEEVDLFCKDRRGRTALDWARLGRHGGCAQLLEDAMSADIEKKRKENDKYDYLFLFVEFNTKANLYVFVLH